MKTLQETLVPGSQQPLRKPPDMLTQKQGTPRRLIRPVWRGR